MSEFKGTPGPWHWNSDDGLWSEKNGEVLVASDDNKPYGMHSAIIEHHYDPEIKKANKTLIEAAPELLEALRDLLIAAENIGGEHVEGMTHLDETLQAARAAIAKALGESK